jgi:hypothetical protein
MSNDFDFENARPQNKKIDFKNLFFNPHEGTNAIRIVGYKKEDGSYQLPAKSFKVHYVQDVTKKYVFVKSPGAGDPLIVNGNQPRTRYYLKVIDRESNKLKIWEFGSQIKQQIEEFVNDLKDKRAKGSDEDDVLSNYNIEIRKRKPGSNPLYMLSVRERITDKKTLEDDQRIINSDDIDFAPLLKPWSIERIKEQILGIGGGEGSSSSDESDSEEQASAPAPAPAPVEKKAAAPATTTSKQPVMQAAAKADNSWLEED